MAHKWFETVEIARQRAERTLPRSVFSALKAGSEAGQTLVDNVAAFRQLGFVPTVADKPAERVQTTSVLGQTISMPVLISPTGVQMVHPEAEIGIARAAANRGTALGLSNFGSTAVERVMAENPQTFFQIYWCGTREQMAPRIDRAKRAGVPGLIVTLDWSFSHGRDWGSPDIPEQLDLAHVGEARPRAADQPGVRLALRPRRPRAPLAARPARSQHGSGGRAATGVLRGLRPVDGDAAPVVGRPALAARPVGRSLHAQGRSCGSPTPSKAVDAGFSAISVSNHGGNNLDTTPAPIRALPVIADAVGDRIEVVMDGGIRRGSDVVKAVALGARAVMIGRASLWALAVGGQAGVENVLDVLRNGIDSAMLGLGKASLAELSPTDIVVPDGFSDAFIQADRPP